MSAHEPPAWEPVTFSLNGQQVEVRAAPTSRLSEVLRAELFAKGTKVGCNAGDCGACTVLLDEAAVCACLVPLGRMAGRSVRTVEGLARGEALCPVQASFHRHGAAQCGICTPGMLLAAQALLSRTPRPTRAQAVQAIGGVLCRCTGYTKIVEAIVAVGRPVCEPDTQTGQAVGARLAKVDGIAKVTGQESYGADAVPSDALWLRIVRSPHARARFALGDTSALIAKHDGLVRILTAADVLGAATFGVLPTYKDQPIFASGQVRFRGEAIAALLGDAHSVAAIPDAEFPVQWEPLAPVLGVSAGLLPDAPQLHDDRPGNILVRGRLVKGDAEQALAAADFTAAGTWQTSFVEHAYIEPEAGWARRVGDVLELHVSTQTPYMDRDEVAEGLGIAPEQVRVIPTACGGGFGGKLDMAVQPLIALAAWLCERPVALVYERPESMASTTKRHPARISAQAGCTKDGLLTALKFHGDFDTGAYASWGPVVAGRATVHATGPYAVPNVQVTNNAVLTNVQPSGAFRGFGTPQAALAHETLCDMLAEQCGLDRLDFRLKNALRVGQATATGQLLQASAGLVQCLEALRPRWAQALLAAAAHNRLAGPTRRGVGIGCMWYGCGNTSMSNPSTIELGLAPSGRLTLYNGAVDIGQGSNTVLVQIAADALGVPTTAIEYIMGDTGLTHDAGKTSASRQTFVSGRAAQLAGEALRGQLLELAGVGTDACLELGNGCLGLRTQDTTRWLYLWDLPRNARGDVLSGTGTFDPPTIPPDANGLGSPYATYSFAAQLAEVLVDPELGVVRVERIVAAHDVGRAINPTQVEGQIQGGIAQGLGFALMEEYLPGRTENLHDYLIPTAGDMPEIEIILIEDPEPTGPFGAKGVGEAPLIPTAPAILSAIHHATGARLQHVPALPHRVRAAIVASQA